MKRTSIVLVVLVCAAPPPTQAKEESLRSQEPAGPKEAIAIPQVIKDQLLSADDIKEGSTLEAEIITKNEEPPRLLVSAHGRYMCSPTGNCPYWIFRQTPTGYEMEADLGEVQMVIIQPDNISQFHEVLVKQHGSATSSAVRLYRVDGDRYRLIKCMTQDYQDPLVPDRILDKPIIRDISCN